MNDLIQTQLFSILPDSPFVKSHEIEHAYEDFITRVENFIQLKEDLSVTLRILNFTRIELQSLQTQILYEQGKKCT